MTVLVGFYCSDGAVIGSDSALTSSIGQLSTAEHTGTKVFKLNDEAVFAFSGDAGLGHRAKFIIQTDWPNFKKAQFPIQVCWNISVAILNNFKSTHVQSCSLQGLLGFVHSDGHYLCSFEGSFQPRLLDEDHFYVSQGSGARFADPFLIFLKRAFCSGQPRLGDARFLATWALDHVIETNTGGVKGPIQMGELKGEAGDWLAGLLDEAALEEPRSFVEEAYESLRTYARTLGGDPDAPSSAVPDAQNDKAV